jgi:DNA-binding beta-propeller fold protein YncE
MPIPAPTTIATGFADGFGCAYQRSTDRLFVVDAGAGSIVSVTAHAHVRTVVGTGYDAPHDIVLSADGLHAYVTEAPGTLLRVALSSPNRAAATVVASGLNGIDQLALDEAHGCAYVAEFSAARLQKIDLASGTKTVVATALSNPRGVLLTGEGRFAYVSTDAGNVMRFDFATNTHAVIASGLSGPRHLAWADDGESAILFAQPNPGGRVMKLDLTASPPAVTEIAGPTAAAPYSVAVIAPDKVLVVCANSVGEIDFTGSVFSATGPVLLGIGFVPADPAHLPNGYADTSMDPSYFFQVKDCPFGGTLPLQINWQTARNQGASYYQVYVQNQGGPAVLVQQPFSDYLWSPTLNEFELVTKVPQNGFYKLRSTGEIWLNSWLGLLLDTSGQQNNLNTITVRLFADENMGSEIGHESDPGRSAKVMIDNTVPTANIEQILHDGAPVNTCAIVTSGSTNFTFRITASAPRHLRGWSMTAYWGDNLSKAVASDDYANHVSASKLWPGVTSGVVPPPGPAPWNAAVAGDFTSTHCAHTFFLSAWDRVIDGWGFVHGPAGYSKSITLML